jgi:hypothetical protein
MLQTPALVVSFILISIYAAIFQLWQGKRLRDLLLFWMASAVGFISGQVVGTVLNFVPLTIGQVHIVEATALSLLFLFLARWLRLEKKTP